MDHFDAALKRLVKAADRLESAVDLSQQRFDKQRDGLNQALLAARAEQARSQSTADGVSTRLDGAIERLNAVLER